MACVARLPDYAIMLSAYHRAYEGELRHIIDTLSISAGDRVLDVACGDGAYARWLAERVGTSGLVVAIDLLPAYVDVAARAAGRSRLAFAVADVARLPFEEGTFDLAWCAQSLYSLPDPVAALRRIVRVVRPGGVVAVLENDSLHHMLLPWPIEVELAVREAELRSFVEQSEKPRKFYVGRELRGTFRAAGIVDVHVRSSASDRQAPLTPDGRTFVEEYLRDLRERTAPRLEPRVRAQFERLVDPESDAYLLDDPDLTVTCLDHLVWGVRPSPEQSDPSRTAG